MATRTGHLTDGGHQTGPVSPGAVLPGAGCRNDRLDVELDRLVAETAVPLLERKGLCTDTIVALLVAAGNNPQRLKNEGSFAALCGASPVDASSGKQQRHPLNRAGDRQATRPYGASFSCG